MFPMKWLAGVTIATISAVLLVPVAHAQKRIVNFASDDDVFL
ncbi:MAG: hypothetical protein V7642_4287, partial [Burkholderiales bacterium]